MGNFNNRNNRFGGNRSGGRSGNRFGGDSRGNFGGEFKPTLHPATCDSCGMACEVPFRPTGEKPVYCRDCFKKIAAASDSSSRDGNPRRFEERAPRNPHGTQVYRPGQRDDAPRGHDTDHDHKQIAEQIRTLNAKLDQILAVLQPTPAAKVHLEIITPLEKSAEPELEADNAPSEAPAKAKAKTAAKKPAKKPKAA